MRASIFWVGLGYGLSFFGRYRARVDHFFGRYRAQDAVGIGRGSSYPQAETVGIGRYRARVIDFSVGIGRGSTMERPSKISLQ
jgi:hypothetical protein